MQLRSRLAPAFVLLLALAVTLVPQAGFAAAPLIAGAGADGQVALPDLNSCYRTPKDVHEYLRNGGTRTAELDIKHAGFLNVASSPGGALGGTVETFDSTLHLTINGLPEGPLEGLTLQVDLPADAEVHAGPQGEGSLRSFDTTMMRLQGSLPAPDANFEYFEIEAGDVFGLPSPGHTTLIEQEKGSFLVDSRFDIQFRIRFRGAAGGPLEDFEDEIEGQATVIAVGE